MNPEEADALLTLWGRVLHREFIQQSGHSRSGVVPRSGDALQELPDTPQGTLSEEQFERISTTIVRLPTVDRHVLKRRYRDHSDIFNRSRHWRNGLRVAVKRFSREY